MVTLRITLCILIADESLHRAQLALTTNQADVLTGKAVLLRAAGPPASAATF